jgi:hypothetical protein
MSSIQTALSEVLSYYKGVTIEIREETPERTLLTVWNERIPSSYLTLEILNVQGTPAACVLERVNLCQASTARFMDRLMDALD